MKNRKRLVAVSTVVIASLAFTALTVPAKAASEINVLMVGNPQMKDLQTLTAENFTKDSGIKVNFTILPEPRIDFVVTNSTNCSTATGEILLRNVDPLFNISTYVIPYAAFVVHFITFMLTAIVLVRDRRLRWPIPTKWSCGSLAMKRPAMRC